MMYLRQKLEYINNHEKTNMCTNTYINETNINGCPYFIC